MSEKHQDSPPFKTVLTDQKDAAEREAILQPLLRFNDAAAGSPDYRPLNLLVRDSTDSTIGGLWGHTAFGWLVIELLYLPEALRGRELGTTLLTRAENEALDRGCHSAWLDTHAFQAKGFYQKLGYDQFGELPDYPKGFARYFLRKTLSR